MPPALGMLRRIFGSEPAQGPDVPFTVVCRCGGIVRGLRQKAHQLIACPSCGRRVFVLPRSPLPPPPGLDGEPSPEAAPPDPPRAARGWLGPIGAAGAVAVAVVALFIALWPYLTRTDRQPSSEQLAREIRAGTESGRRSLAEGQFRRASRDLSGALDLADRHALLEPSEHRQLARLAREADLLARLLTEPLEEVCRQATLARDEEEWKALFADYAGRSVVFDDVVGRDARGRPHPQLYTVYVRNEAVRLALEDLAALRDVPLDPPQRLLFGGRLAAVEREPGGWVVRFEPGSGVLLTDPDAAHACCPALGDIDDVLRRQGEWLTARGQ